MEVYCETPLVLSRKINGTAVTLSKETGEVNNSAICGECQLKQSICDGERLLHIQRDYKRSQTEWISDMSKITFLTFHTNNMSSDSKSNLTPQFC